MQISTSGQSFLILTIISVFILSSCNNRPVDVPFPVSEKGYPQPQSQPLQFSAPKKLEWIVAKEGIKSTVKKLDIDALPTSPYDPNGFKPLLAPPDASHFDFNALRDTVFNLQNIPSESLEFRTSILMRPTVVRVVPPSPKAGSPLSILEIGRAQGIQEKDVLCLLRSRDGFIWIGTGKGIYRFDGENMQGYPLSSVAGMIEDSEGRIWYLWDGGLGILDIRHGSVSISRKISAPFPNLPRMIMDHNGNIWVPRIRTRGIDVINPKTLTVKHLNRGTGLSGSDAWGVFEDNKKNIWVSTNDGADIFNLEKGNIRYLKNINGHGMDSLRAITGGKNGTVWIGFNHGGLHAINIEKGSVTSYGKKQGFHKHLTYSLLYDIKERVWMATNEGLVIVDPEKGMARSFKVSDGITEDFVLDVLQDDKQRVWVASFNGGLSVVEQNAEVIHPVSVKSLSTIMEDSSGKIWVGAAGNNEGIQILDRDKKLIRNLGKQQGLGDDFIQNVMEVDGNILIGTNGGFDIIDLKRKTIEHTGKKEGLADEQIYGILKDKDGSIWLAGPALGINRIDFTSKRLLHAGVAQGLSEDNVSEIKQDAQGKIWIATNKRGVDRIDPENWTIQNLSNAPGLRDTCNRLLLPDKQGRMWIGTDKGIYVADPNQNTLTAITTTEGLCNNHITSLVTYDDNVVAGTRNKVSIIRAPSPDAKPSETNWKIGQLAASEGLFNSTNNWNTNMITRKGEYFWGDVGVTIIKDFKIERDSASTYITGLSVMSQRLNFANPVSLGERDTLWQGGSYFIKGQVPENSGYVQQERFQWDSLTAPYSIPVNLHIPYDQNYLQFQFAQRHLGRTDATLYSYILLGIDKQWSEFSSNTFTENYLNLLPGNYTFKVRSQDISGRWGKAAVFNFTISPPWWKTWWAYSIYVISLVGSIGGFIQFRSKQLLRENRLLEEKVEHRTSQLKKSLDDLKSTQSQLIQSEKMASLGELTAGIAHEIQNPLNFVNNFSDVNIELTDELKEELDKLNLSPTEKLSLEKIADSIRNNQEKITFHGKRADSIVKGMLQHSRNSSGAKEPTNINALSDEYLRLAYHGLRARDKSFNAVMKTDFDETVGMINVVPQDVGRAILNLITNAFHAVIEKKTALGKNAVGTGVGYEPTVTVSTKRLGNKVEIKVKDNGNGIPKQVLDKIFQPFFTTKPSGQGTGLGLSLSYDIVKAHGGELKVETKEGEGTEFILSLPEK